MKIDLFKSLREREKHITRLHIILFALVVIIAFAVLITIYINKNIKIKRYKKLEKDLYTASVYYYSDKEDNIGKGELKVITMNTIIKHGYLQDELTAKCKGYTLVSNYKYPSGKYKIQYESFIKCGDSYKTGGFEEDYLK